MAVVALLLETGSWIYLTFYPSWDTLSIEHGRFEFFIISWAKTLGGLDLELQKPFSIFSTSEEFPHERKEEENRKIKQVVL